ncbi:MAG TPA: AI-2E family transporter [Myxococcota bacterium]|nr:AI-2E family transporter [Myxococcota bacterium]
MTASATPAAGLPAPGGSGPDPQARARAELYRRIAVGVAVFLFLTLTIYVLKAALTPIIAAFILAYFLDPVIDWFEARRIPRTVAIVLLLVAALGVLTLCALFIIPRVAEQFALLIVKIGAFVQQLASWVQTRFGFSLPHTLQETLDNFGADLKNLAPSAAGSAGTVIGWVFSGTVNVLVTILGLVFIPVFAFYFLRDFDLITAQLYTLVPFAQRPLVRSVFREVDETLANFIRGQVTVAAVKATLYAVLLSFAGIKLSVVIGAIAGFGALVPYLGAAIGGGLSALMVAVDFNGWGQVLFVILIFAGVETADGLFITPKLLGDRVGLSPVAVIVALLVGGELLGFAGVLLAVPAAAVIRILVRRAVEAYRGTAFFAGSSGQVVVIHDPAEIDEFTRQARCACGGSFKIEERGPEGATLLCARGDEVRRLVVKGAQSAAAAVAGGTDEGRPGAGPGGEGAGGGGAEDLPARRVEPLPEPDARSVARVVSDPPQPPGRSEPHESRGRNEPHEPPDRSEPHE